MHRTIELQAILDVLQGIQTLWKCSGVLSSLNRSQHQFGIDHIWQNAEHLRSSVFRLLEMHSLEISITLVVLFNPRVPSPQPPQS